MISETRHIDFHLPRSWNQCTTDELERIASVIALQTLHADRYHPFDMLAAKVEIFFSINRLEVLKPGEDAYTVRFASPKHPWWRKAKKEEPFELPVSAVHSMITEHLSWLDAEDAEPLLLVPYPSLTLRKSLWRKVTVDGPTPLLDGYTWEQYRFLQDYMQAYMNYSNTLSRLSRFHNDQLPQVIELTKKVDEAQANFLSVLFQSPTTHHPSPITHHFFTHFDPIKWQVILFWWSGLMKYLQKQYPRCFKADKPGKHTKQKNPLQLYTRTTATMEKYIGLNEQEVNQQSFHVILQHMEDMSKEAEEMKRISKNHGSKR